MQTIEKMKNMYEWNAKDYSLSSAEQYKWAQELISKLVLKGNERILDIGCGDGKATADVAKQLPNGSILGIDNSEEMIHFAQKKFLVKRFPNLNFEVMDARYLSFKNEFDIVISNACLHWIIGHLSVLERIKESLKSSGKVLLQMAGRGSGRKIVKIMEENIKNEKWSEYFKDFSTPYGFYGPREYKDWLERVGLKAKQVKLVPKDMIHENIEGLRAWIRTTWLPYTEKIPKDSLQNFIDDVVSRYIDKYPPDRRGFFHIELIRLDVEAEKW